jgi:hypothetical protein
MSRFRRAEPCQSPRIRDVSLQRRNGSRFHRLPDRLVEDGVIGLTPVEIGEPVLVGQLARRVDAAALARLLRVARDRRHGAADEAGCFQERSLPGASGRGERVAIAARSRVSSPVTEDLNQSKH